MQTYLRIMGYARPIGKYVAPYFLFTILGVVFGLVNFSLLIPLFDVLFKTSSQKQSIPESAPEFRFDQEFFIDLFYYHFGRFFEQHGALGALQFVCITIIISVVLTNIFRYASILIVERVRANTLNRLRTHVFDSTIDLHLGYFTNQRKGDLMSRLQSDVMQVEGSVGTSFRAFIREPFTIIGYFVVLFTMSARLTFFTLLVVPISGFLIATIVRRIREGAKQSQQALGQMTSLIDEAFNGIRIIKAFNGENYIKNSFYRQSKRYVNLIFDINRKHEGTSPTSEVLGVSVVAGILLYGGSLVLTNDPDLAMKPSQFVTYIILFSQVMRPAKGITSSISSIQRGLAAADRIFSLVDEKPHIVNRPGAEYLHRFEREIVFDDVDFGYEKDLPVLQDINFTIKKGETVALVGPSGGGKSTIADLFPRFYDTTNGSISIDGIDLRNYDVHSIRAHMGIVTQESILFNDTVFNNIAFCKTDATLEEVKYAAKIANAAGFIEQMDNSYFSIIGDRGIKLSGGQRQRISIARAVLMNPEILILDEATSALDTESEKLVQKALNNLMENRTSLVIAHRLSTIHHADKIIVIDNGCIVETGTHSTLMNMEDGLYKKLNMMQNLA